MNEKAIDELVREVVEYFDAGVVGLYEFPVILRSDHPEVPSDELVTHSSEALRRLRLMPDVRQVWEVWARDETRDATGVEPRPQDWETPTAEPYLALERVNQTESV